MSHIHHKPEIGERYTDLKMLHHFDVIYEMRHQWCAPVPKHLYLILTDFCQLNCSFCCHRSETGVSSELFGELNPKRFIPIEKIEEMLSDASDIGVLAIEFTGGGDPTAHPYHIDAFGMALENGMDVGVVTHGCHIKDDPVYTKINWIRVSLDAATPKTYQAIKGFNKFDKAVTGIELLTRQRAGDVGVSFVVTPENYLEIYEAAGLVKEIGVNNFRITAEFDSRRGEHLKGFMPEIRNGIIGALSLTTDSFEVFSSFSGRLDDLSKHKVESKFCGQQALSSYIGADLGVYRCCTTSYTEIGKIGSLAHRTLSDFYTSDDYDKAVYGFDATKCTFCMHHSKNKLINYVISDNVKDVNFV